MRESKSKFMGVMVKGSVVNGFAAFIKKMGNEWLRRSIEVCKDTEFAQRW